MKITDNITVYQCEFCKKKLFRKHAMEHHEKYCRLNPEMERVCYDCIFKKETVVKVHKQGEHGEPYTEDYKAYSCEKLNTLIYHPIVERKKMIKKMPSVFENQIPMKKDCEHYENAHSDICDHREHINI